MNFLEFFLVGFLLPLILNSPFSPQIVILDPVFDINSNSRIELKFRNWFSIQFWIVHTFIDNQSCCSSFM